MAEDKRYVGYDEAKYLWDKAAERYVRKEEGKGLSENNFTDEDKAKLAEVEPLRPASGNELGGVIIGEGLAVDEEGVVSVVSAGAVEWEDVHDTPTTLAGYGIEDAATKDELEEVKEQVTKAYHFKGSVDTYEDLEDIEDPEEGDVYNVRDTGKNYAWVVEGGTGYWDDLGGVFEIETLTQHDLDMITGSASTPDALVDLIEQGGDVEVESDMLIDQPITVNTVVNLSLNGHYIESTVNGYMFTADGGYLSISGGGISASKRIAQAVNGGTVSIDSGTYSSGDVALTASGEGSTVIINGGDVTAVEGGVGAFDQANIIVNSGIITGTDNFPVFTNGTAGRGGNTIVINGGELRGNITSEGYEACGIYIANNDSLTINGGTIISNGGCGILMRAGNVEINDCYIEATTGEHVPGWVGDNKTQMSASAVIYHEKANYPGKAGMSLTINGGTFIGADHALEVLSNEATPNVTVNGGEFTPAYPEE